MITVRMCEQPGCEGPARCPDVRLDRRTMGTTMTFHRDRGITDEEALRVLRQELALSAASDSAGIKHMVPAEAVFVVHKWPDGSRRPHAIDISGDLYSAAYTGERDLDDLLADSPEYSTELVEQRLAELKAA